MKLPTIFVDESGSPSPKTPNSNSGNLFFTIGFCYCKNPKSMEKKLSRLLKKLQNKDMYSNKLCEFKFFPKHALKKLKYTDEDIKSRWEPHFDVIREKVLEIIINKSDGVFAGTLDKTQVYGKNYTTEQIGNMIFKESLFDYILPNLNYSKDVSVIYDRGRLNPTKTRKFDQNMQQRHTFSSGDIMMNHFFEPKTFHDADSKQTPGIWASDFIAGAFHLALKHNDTRFRDRLTPKFIGKGSKIFEFK